MPDVWHSRSGNRGFGEPWHARHIELRDVVDERAVQPDQAVIDETHHRCRGERLRARCDRKDRYNSRSARSVAVAANAKRLVQHDGAASCHQYDEAWHISLLDPACGELP